MISLINTISLTKNLIHLGNVIIIVHVYLKIYLDFWKTYLQKMTAIGLEITPQKEMESNIKQRERGDRRRTKLLE